MCNLAHANGPDHVDDDAHEDGAAAPIYLPLVEAARRGDRVAFARLYDQFEPVVRGIALSRVGPAHAQDVAHDVFVTVLQRVSTLRDPASFPGWIASIARNRAADVARSRRETTDAVDPAAASASEDERAEGILMEIQRLPVAYAETLTLRFVEGMTGPEIAARTGMTHASVRVNLCRGMKLLRERLAERGHHVG